jgi:hypothetical protein
MGGAASGAGASMQEMEVSAVSHAPKMLCCPEMKPDIGNQDRRWLQLSQDTMFGRFCKRMRLWVRENKRMFRVLPEMQHLL